MDVYRRDWLARPVPAEAALTIVEVLGVGATSAPAAEGKAYYGWQLQMGLELSTALNARALVVPTMIR
jgi:hypothetical protein